MLQTMCCTYKKHVPVNTWCDILENICLQRYFKNCLDMERAEKNTCLCKILSPWSVLYIGKCFPLVLWDKWATNRSNDSVTFQFLHRTFSWLISFKTKWLYYVYSFVFMWPAMLWLFQCHDKVGMLTFKYDSLFVKCLNVKNVLIAKNNLCHGTHNIGSNSDLIFKISPLWKKSL